jgi:hypothetical protein
MKKTHGTKRAKARKSTVKDLSPRKAGHIKAGRSDIGQKLQSGLTPDTAFG